MTPANRPPPQRKRSGLSRRRLLVAALPCGAATAQAAEVAVTTATALAAPVRQAHALLIGVASVHVLPPRLSLRGPDHDVALMRRVLQQRGVPAANTTTLSGAPGDTPPTRQAMADAMQALLARVQAGDGVVLHLAGHAVQVPQRPASAAEPDAMDEVFLAQDTGVWDAARGELPRALYDHDIGAWLDALAARGARVLAIIDACHAAGLQRAAGEARFTRERGLAAAELGVPTHTPSAATTGQKPAAAHSGMAAGQIPAAWPSLAHVGARQGLPVLAFAARGHESTPEAWLPAAARDGRVHGVFSHAVASALQQGVADAAALRDEVTRQYAAAGRSQPVPMVLGVGLLPLPTPAPGANGQQATPP